MSRAGRLLFVFGILVALISGFFVFFLLMSNQPKPVQVPTTNVVIAFQNIAARSQVDPEQVGIAEWPLAVPTPAGGFARTVDVVGKLATAPIYPGQPVTEKMVIDKEEVKETHSNAALILEKGTVAIAMPVSIRSNVADAIQAGDRVDMIATFRSTSQSGAGSAATQRLLADVLILQVGPWPAPGAQQQAAQGTSIVTFQLKEQDALVLHYALESAGSITLVLRPANDHDLVTLEPVTFDYINQRFGFKLPK
jgi:Flp pilus assembly protein CpaB